MLRPRILQLFESVDPDDAEPSAIGRLKGLCSSFAKVAAQQDCELILNAMALPGRFDSYSRLSAVESLYSRGLPLRHEGLERVFADLWNKARQSRWLDDSDSHCLACSMQGLAFSDHPDRAMPIWREFSDRFRGNERGDLLMAIISSGFEGCLELSYELDCHFDPNKRSWAFVEGILRYSAAERAASLLIDVLLGGDWRALDRGVSYHQRNGLNQVLSDRIENNRQTRLSLVEVGQNDRERRNWIAFLLGSSGEIGLTAALELLDDAADEPVPGGLWNAITEKWLVDQIPISPVRTAWYAELRPIPRASAASSIV